MLDSSSEDGCMWANRLIEELLSQVVRWRVLVEPLWSDHIGQQGLERKGQLEKAWDQSRIKWGQEGL